MFVTMVMAALASTCLQRARPDPGRPADPPRTCSARSRSTTSSSSTSSPRSSSPRCLFSPCAAARRSGLRHDGRPRQGAPLQHDGRTHHFCSEHCRATFAADGSGREQAHDGGHARRPRSRRAARPGVAGARSGRRSGRRSIEAPAMIAAGAQATSAAKTKYDAGDAVDDRGQDVLQRVRAAAGPAGSATPRKPMQEDPLGGAEVAAVDAGRVDAERRPAARPRARWLIWRSAEHPVQPRLQDDQHAGRWR